MARFDVHRDTRGRLLLNVQADILPEMGTRLVVPLLEQDQIPLPIKRLHPVIVVDGIELIMATHLMAAVPLRTIGRPLQSLKSDYDRIVAALDMIFLGF
jgi:toxin CcdB